MKSEKQLLTAISIKFLPIKETRYDIADIPGLSLRVEPTGKKTWRLCKSVDGKRIFKTLGTFPELSITEARNIVKQYSSNVVITGKAKRQLNTFGNIFRDFVEVKKTQILHWEDIDIGIRKYLLDDLDKELWDNITPLMLINLINKNVPDKYVSIKTRLCTYITGLEKYAVNTGRTNRGFHFQSISSALPKYTPNHMSTIPYTNLSAFIKVFYERTGLPFKSRLAKWDYWTVFLVGSYTLLRPAEYLSIKWDYIDLDRKVITIPAENMKMKETHQVPMSEQLVAVISSIEKKEGYDFIFPQMKDGTATQLATFNGNYCRAFKRVSKEIKDKLVPHGLRAMGRTWMSENRIDFDVAEHCLAHSVGNETVISYNRTTLLEKRRVAMQKWCDFVESCIKDADLTL